MIAIHILLLTIIVALLVLVWFAYAAPAPATVQAPVAAPILSAAPNMAVYTPHTP